MKLLVHDRFVELVNHRGVCVARHECTVPAGTAWGPPLARQAVLAGDLELLSWAWHHGCVLGDAAGLEVQQRTSSYEPRSRVLEWLVEHRDPSDSSALVQAVQTGSSDLIE